METNQPLETSSSGSLVSIISNLKDVVENINIFDIPKWIASDKFKTEVEEIRLLIRQNKNDEVQEKKMQLLGFTPSATFNQIRKGKNINQYSGFVHLDFDKIWPLDFYKVFKIISDIPYTVFCFRSPTGTGLKVFVEVTTGIENHSDAYTQVMQHYEKATGLKADEKCKDIPRLCFMSYDPKLYSTSDYKKFEVDTTHVEVIEQIEIESPQQKIGEDGLIAQLEDCIRFTEQKKKYSEGNRNDFIYSFACTCNRKGIPEDIAMHYAQSTYDLPEKEIRASFRSAYIHHTGEFAKFANIEKLQTNAESKIVEDFLKNTPSIPEDLYFKMPQIIQHGAMAFSDCRERDVFLTGSLAILSGCMPGVKGVYAGQEVFPNIFSFIIAPAASGKGALKFAKMLADEYHNTVLTTSRETEAQYIQELSEHKQKISSKKKGDTTMEEAPAKPTFKVVYIPANTSYAKILWHLEQNDGSGIICETEADTLGNVFKQEWGSYSDMLRKSFHHERISSSRKQNNEFTEVNMPSLSIALSGTPNQVTGLIASAEDGLFSRFIFYAFKVEQVWRDVSPNAHNINLTDHFKKLGIQVLELVNFLKAEDTEIELTYEQWQQLNQQCEVWLNDITMFTAEEAASIVKRLGLILYRITMLFTALRKFENGEAATKMICTDDDFKTAIQLVEIYLHHSILMFNNLPKQADTTNFKTGDSKRQFIEALPNEFTTKEAVEIGKQFYLSYSTVTHLLPKLVGKYFTQPKAGYYIKI